MANTPLLFAVFDLLTTAGGYIATTAYALLTTLTTICFGLGVWGFAFWATIVSILLAIWIKLWPIVTKPILFSWLLHHGSIISPSEERYRRDFSSLKMRRFREKDNHSHGISAGRRTVAKRFMCDYAIRTGLNPFQVQQSLNDQKHGVGGCRTYYWSKDMTMDYSFKTPGKHDLILLTDVDYYVDMPWFLAWNAKPTLLYTFVPSVLAKSEGETSFCFHKDNSVEYRVSGGGFYQHKLWDYSADNLVSTWSVLGLPIITTTYHIERRNIDEDHMMILLTPIRYFYGPIAWLASFLDGYRLKRLEVVDGEFTRLRVQEKDQLYMCTGKVGTYVHAKVPIEQDSAIAVAARIMKNDITPPTVQSYIGTDFEFKTPAVIITAYHRSTTGFKPPVVYPVHHGVKDYTFKPDVFYEHSKSSLVGFMSPIIDACYAPTDTKANEEVSIEERVTKILSDKPMPDEYMDFAKEFIDLLVPKKDVNAHMPMTLDDVYERQNKPSQRRLIDEGSFYGPHMDKLRKVAPFPKNEAHQEPKPPRNISVINSRDKIDYSCIIYAAAELFKENAHWYAFGKTPREIANRVVEVCQAAEKHAVNSDLSRFDGRLALAFRVLEEMFLLRMFPTHLHDHIIELHNSQFGLRGRCKHGTEYFTGFSRLSGSPETALFNSLANAFMVYVTKRVCGQNPAQAWNSMGIYGGDDGLTADLNIAKYTSVCQNLGMKTTAESVPKGKIGIKFLARIYSPEVWSGSADSCADFHRQLSKIHATPHLPANVTANEKLIEKARGFFLSDYNTPVIGLLARRVMDLTISNDWSDDTESVAVLELGGDQPLVLQTGTASQLAAQPVTNYTISKELRNYASFAPVTEQYPNTDETCWMTSVLEQQIPTFSHTRFETHLRKADTLEKLLKFPLCAEPVRPVVTQAVVVGDETLSPPAPTPPTDQKEEQPPIPPSDPHAQHKWRDPETCYACHPELAKPKTKTKEADPAEAGHAEHTWWSDPTTCYACHPHLDKRKKEKGEDGAAKQPSQRSRSPPRNRRPQLGPGKPPRNSLQSVPERGESSSTHHDDGLGGRGLASRNPRRGSVARDHRESPRRGRSRDPKPRGHATRDPPVLARGHSPARGRPDNKGSPTRASATPSVTYAQVVKRGSAAKPGPKAPGC